MKPNRFFAKTSSSGIPVTKWLCPVCLNYANVKFGDYIFCRKHWREFMGGHGDKTLMEMITEYKKENG